MKKRKHELLSEAEREILFGIPTDRDLLARLYSFEPTDIDIIGVRREKRNQLGAALQLALLRHPGTPLAQMLQDKREVPAELLAFVAEQIVVSPTVLSDYAARGQTMTDHARELAAKLGVRGPVRADVFVIAPATADCLARLAHGMTSDMVTLTALATTAPILTAPAMDNQMWEHPATQENVTTLRNRGVEFVGPMEGRLASGRSGLGRLAEVPQVVGAVRMLIGQRSGDLAGRHIVVSAGGTQEPLDPVRYVGNRSTGKMGFAIAEAARDRGAHVTLVTGPVALETPYGIHRVDVNTVAEMLVALEQATADSDAIIMSAAPADYRPANPSAHKLKKSSDEGALDIELVKNPDIIATLPPLTAGARRFRAIRATTERGRPGRWPEKP